MPVSPLQIFIKARRFFRRITKPLRLWINSIQFNASEREIERLRMLRADTVNLEQIEQAYQVKLAARHQAILRGLQ